LAQKSNKEAILTFLYLSKNWMGLLRSPETLKGIIFGHRN
jgi:hypothetical protein